MVIIRVVIERTIGSEALFSSDRLSKILVHDLDLEGSLLDILLKLLDLARRDDNVNLGVGCGNTVLSILPGVEVELDESLGKTRDILSDWNTDSLCSLVGDFGKSHRALESEKSEGEELHVDDRARAW